MTDLLIPLAFGMAAAGLWKLHEIVTELREANRLARLSEKERDKAENLILERMDRLVR